MLHETEQVGVSGTLMENLLEQMQRHNSRNTALREQEQEICQEQLNIYMSDPQE